MRKVKLVIGLAFCLGALLSVGTLQRNTATNVGWGLSKLCKSGEAVTVVTEAAVGGMGAYAGAEIGAGIGCIGGPAGAIIGGVVGAL